MPAVLAVLQTPPAPAWLPPRAKAVKYAEYLPSKLSPQTRGFLTVDYYSNHFLVGSANLSFAASPALPLSLSSRRKLCSVDSTARLPPSSLRASSFLPPCLLLPPSVPPSHGDAAPGTPGHMRERGSARRCPRDPCPGMGSLPGNGIPAPAGKDKALPVLARGSCSEV